MAYGPSSDPTHDIELATPSKGLRLLVVRAATVQGIAIVLLGLVSLTSSVETGTSLAWLLPSFGLTSITVALMAVLSPRRAVTLAGVGWVTTMLVVSRGLGEPLDAFGATTQVAALLTVVAASVVLRRQRERFDVLREHS